MLQQIRAQKLSKCSDMFTVSSCQADTVQSSQHIFVYSSVSSVYLIVELFGICLGSGVFSIR